MCHFCSGPVAALRAEAGYNYCTASACVAQGLALSRQNYVLVLMPKQGFTYIERSDPNLRVIGKSSGRAN